MFAVDLHAHTRFFHGHPRAASYYDQFGYRMLSRIADRRKLDAVALTNHDYYRPLGSPVAGGGEIVAIPGIEITTTTGHVLVVGPDPPRQTTPGELTPEEAVERAHDRGCAAIIAHPYRNSTVRESDTSFDAIEINGKHPVTWPLVRELAAERDVPVVGGSDAHYPFEVGRAHTLVDADELSPTGVVDAIQRGAVEPDVYPTRFGRLLERGYDAIHAARGHRSSPDSTPGIGRPPGAETTTASGE